MYMFSAMVKRERHYNIYMPMIFCYKSLNHSTTNIFSYPVMASKIVGMLHANTDGFDMHSIWFWSFLKWKTFYLIYCCCSQCRHHPNNHRFSSILSHFHTLNWTRQSAGVANSIRSIGAIDWLNIACPHVWRYFKMNISESLNWVFKKEIIHSTYPPILVLTHTSYIWILR